MNTTFLVGPKLLADLASHLWDPERERAALLAGHKAERIGALHFEVLRFLPAANVHPEPWDNFRVGMEQWAKIRDTARSSGLELVGLVHSHPYHAGPEPSDTDLRLARQSRWERLYAVYHAKTGVYTWYNRTGILGRSEGVVLPMRLRFAKMMYPD